MLEVIWRSALIVSLSQFWWNAREGKQTFPWTHDRTSWTSLKIPQCSSASAPPAQTQGEWGGFGGGPRSETCTIQLACSAFVLFGWKCKAGAAIRSIYKPEQTQHSQSKLLFLIGLELKNQRLANKKYVSDKQLLQKQRLRIVSKVRSCTASSYFLLFPPLFFNKSTLNASESAVCKSKVTPRETSEQTELH